MAFVYFICGVFCSLACVLCGIVLINRFLALLTLKGNGESFWDLLKESFAEGEYGSAVLALSLVCLPFILSIFFGCLFGWGSYELFSLAF